MTRSLAAHASLMLGVVLISVLKADPPAPPADFSAQRFIEHVRVLSSNEFEGRGPGTPGEEKTVSYLVARFKEYGLLPGNPDGTFLQDVPLAGTTSLSTVRFTIGERTLSPEPINDYIAFSPADVPRVEVHASDLIFCGYGVEAPEYHWNDFKDVDVHGKTIVVLVNDPPVPDPNHPGQLDPAVFKGKAMTYYGRWMYKYEEAAAKGAAGCLIVHETGAASYPFAVVAASQGRENFGLRSSTAPTVPVAGWLTLPMAQKLFAACGLRYEAEKRAAVSRDFRPVPMKATADFVLENSVRRVNSRNVIARLPGTDPKRKDEVVIYSAHWDHLGIDRRMQPDPVFHGARDNGTGCAALLELARAYSHTRPQRTVLFLALTAEEKGLLGARYYVQHPLYPLNRTVANLNMDLINVYGPTVTVEDVGMGASTIDDVARALAQADGRTLVAESDPESGRYYRSDHFEFAKGGVPSCMIRGGILFAGHDDAFGEARHDSYYAHEYHKPTDVIRPEWELTGAVQDIGFLYRLGWILANREAWPEWFPASEFRARREMSLGAGAARP